MEQTAVDWLIDKLEREYNSFPLLNSEACIKAQEMEKEQLEKAIEFGAEGMYSRQDLVDFVYFLNDRHFNQYTVDTDEVDLFIEQLKKKY